MTDVHKRVMPVDTAWLPLFQQWQAENAWVSNPNFESYLNLTANLDLVVACSKLFWPDFVEIDGCVLLAEHYSPETFAAWQQQLAGDVPEIEAMINHVDLIYHFMMWHKEAQRAAFSYLGRALLLSWKHALLEAFPEKHFVFSYFDAPELSISFYQAIDGATGAGGRFRINGVIQTSPFEGR